MVSIIFLVALTIFQIEILSLLKNEILELFKNKFDLVADFLNVIENQENFLDVYLGIIKDLNYGDLNGNLSAVVLTDASLFSLVFHKKYFTKNVNSQQFRIIHSGLQNSLNIMKEKKVFVKHVNLKDLRPNFKKQIL